MNFFFVVCKPSRLIVLTRDCLAVLLASCKVMQRLSSVFAKPSCWQEIPTAGMLGSDFGLWVLMPRVRVCCELGATACFY